MIPVDVLNPALQAAHLQSINGRADCARAGMVEALNQFRADSYRCARSRWVDGLGDIDAAVTPLATNWAIQHGAGPTNEGIAITLLKACSAWLVNRQQSCFSMNGCREPSIRVLYWKAAWCYSCDNYAQRSFATVRVNNLAGNATGLNEPVTTVAQGGNPYSVGYVFTPVANPLYRGDSRGPISIQTANGFQGRNVGNLAAFSPWFAGNAMGDTISTTANPPLAINSAKTAHLNGGSPIGTLPAWLNAAIAGAWTEHGNPSQVRGFVYEFGNFVNAQSTRLSTEPAGKEEVFLGLPNNTIQQWWAVLHSGHTVGPFPFPAAAMAPLVVNCAHNQLA
jgi:hypothetical protein